MEGVGWISWILIGLVAGYVAKWIMPGKDPGGIIVTILIGIVGGVIGGWLGSLLNLGSITGFLSIGSLVLAVVGSLILLFIIRQVRK